MARVKLSKGAVDRPTPDRQVDFRDVRYEYKSVPTLDHKVSDVGVGHPSQVNSGWVVVESGDES